MRCPYGMTKARRSHARRTKSPIKARKSSRIAGRGIEKEKDEGDGGKEGSGGAEEGEGEGEEGDNKEEEEEEEDEEDENEEGDEEEEEDDDDDEAEAVGQFFNVFYGRQRRAMVLTELPGRAANSATRGGFSGPSQVARERCSEQDDAANPVRHSVEPEGSGAL